MKCFHCGEELIWNCDYSYEDYGIDDRDGIVHVLSCPYCGALWEGFIPLDEDE